MSTSTREQRGVFAGDGYGPFSSNGQRLLFDVELHWTKSFRSSAAELLSALEGYVWGNKNYAEYERAREQFLEVFREVRRRYTNTPIRTCSANHMKPGN